MEKVVSVREYTQYRRRDADGRFIAINFDRQRQGLMNEFKWSRDYSRSIGTDVRMILYLVGTYDGAQWLGGRDGRLERAHHRRVCACVHVNKNVMLTRAVHPEFE